jgi:eukaryotic-like serine/threonine-protein kinase
MPITDPLILPSDVVFTPMRRVTTSSSKGAQSNAGEYAITRLGSRSPSSVMDAESVEMLNEFRHPKTIAEAILNYSRVKQLDPQTVLEEAFPLLSRLWASRVLVSAESEEAQRIAPSTAHGVELAGFKVLTCLHVLEDTEVYEVETRTGEIAVLKILRGVSARGQEKMLTREAAILNHLDGLISPRLMEAGTADGRPFVLIELCSGIPVHMAAQQLRQRTDSDARLQLVNMCCNILDCYSRLHQREVIHADVHQRNILAAGDGSIRIIDFGIAHWQPASDAWGEPERGGVAFFYAPEYADALRSRQIPPPLTHVAEQYSLAVLVWYLLTGAYYVRFSIEPEEMLRQIVEAPPEVFSTHGGALWPQIESVLAKALSKDPGDRWSSVAEFLLRFRVASRNPRIKRSGASARNAFLRAVLDRLQISQPLFQQGVKPAPTTSVNMGAAGIAYALYRIASTQSNTSLLALADIWATKAAAESLHPGAFYNEDLNMEPETVGRISPYHTASGVHLVQALVSHSRGDLACVSRAVAAFVAVSELPCENLDLTLGQSGTILGSSLLLESLRSTDRSIPTQVSDLAGQRMRAVWERIDTFPAITESSEVQCSGIAHGWGGILYATLHWCQSSGCRPPLLLEGRLRELIDCAEPAGKGLRWKWEISKSSEAPNVYMAGWCGGSAGLVFLWCMAHRMFGDAAYLTLAERAACYCRDVPASMGDLCCGTAGRAYSLLHLYKYTGEKRWLLSARKQADQAVNAIQGSSARPDSLYKGALGVALLIADFENPEASCMPLFESEGWASPAIRS